VKLNFGATTESAASRRRGVAAHWPCGVGVARFVGRVSRLVGRAGVGALFRVNQFTRGRRVAKKELATFLSPLPLPLPLFPLLGYFRVLKGLFLGFEGF